MEHHDKSGKTIQEKNSSQLSGAGLVKTLPVILLFAGVFIYAIGKTLSGSLLILLSGCLAFYFKYRQKKAEKQLKTPTSQIRRTPRRQS